MLERYLVNGIDENNNSSSQYVMAKSREEAEDIIYGYGAKYAHAEEAC